MIAARAARVHRGGQAHRIANQGDETLIIIEVQRGSYTGEDDIVRLEDDYGRSTG